MAEFKNRFSWSYSRDNIFQECKREYYYNYYGSWGGWEKDKADEVTRTLYVLKNLQNRWMWKGSSVHDEIERVLKELVSTGNQVSFEKSRTRITEVMRNDFRSSRDGAYWNKNGSLRNEVALFEHEYRPELSDETWKKNYDEAISCLKNFFESPVLEEVKELPKETEFTIESMSGAYLSFNPELYYVKLDLSYSVEDKITIYDWKTGSGESDELQFLVYALYAHEELDFDPENITVIEFNINDNFTRIHTFTKNGIDTAKKYINDSINSMKSRLINSDENTAKMADFPRTEDRKICELCKFQKICFDLE